MNIGVIFAGGVGSRMHSKDKPKQFLELHNKPVIVHTLEVFEKCKRIDCVVISCLETRIPYLRELIYKYRLDKVKEVVSGGKTGQESIYNGLCAAERISTSDKDIVLIHDGVRPLIDGKLLEANINGVLQYGSAITSSVVKETLLIVNGDNEIKSVPNRNDSRIAKAPQSFYIKDIVSAHRKAIQEGKNDFIDSCTMMQYYGFGLHLVDGSAENIKITTPEDFYIMRAILDAKENAQLYEF